jgi:hypothetical protein
MRQVQPVTDFPVGQSLGRQLDDLQLLSRQLRPGIGLVRPGSPAGGREFLHRSR